MFKGIRLFRIGGINIEIDLSWFFIAALITLSLTSSPMLASADLSGGGAFLTAAAIVVVFFASLLLHELAHSFVAKARGIEVDNIRLFFLGGVSNIKREPRSGVEEFLIAVVGPLTSAVLGGLFLGLRALVGSDISVLYIALGYLGFANLVLAVFNMIPAFPLDGGRVFRAIVWIVTKDNVKSTRIASGLSQGISLLFIAGGVFAFVSGDLFDGLLLGFMGWYLWSAARQTLSQLVAEKLLKGVQVGQVMSQPPEVLLPNAPVSQIVNEFFLAKRYPVVAVVENGYLVGLVSQKEVRQTPPQEWESTRAIQVMQRRNNLMVARVEDDLEETVKKLAEAGQKFQVAMPVLNNEGYFVGLLTTVDVARYLQFRQQYGDKMPTQQPQYAYPYPYPTQQPGYFAGALPNPGWGFQNPPIIQQPTSQRYNPGQPQNPYGGSVS